MKRPRILPIALSLLAAVACGQIVGIRDVPNPEGIGASMDASDATMEDRADARDASRDGSSGGTAGEGAPPGDGSGATADGGVESSAPEAGVDAAACAAAWNTYDDRCNGCGIMQCCDVLAGCERVDQAALDGGMSLCAFLLSCITSYQNAMPYGSHDQMCKDQGQYSPSDLANEDAALSCIRARCPTDCSGL